MSTWPCFQNVKDFPGSPTGRTGMPRYPAVCLRAANSFSRAGTSAGVRCSPSMDAILHVEQRPLHRLPRLLPARN